jgi:hypothetical protein
MPQSSGTSASVMTPAQIATVARNAGWSGSDLTIAVAVALAESGGRPGVVNSIGCVGLWQVYQKVHPKWTTEQLKDPQTNANAAHEIWLSQGWRRGWTTYSHGTYQKYMGQATAGIGLLGPILNGVAPIIGVAGTVAGEAAAVSKAVGILSDPKTWIRVGLVILGALLVLIALARMSIGSGGGKAAIDVAKIGVNFIPGGGVVSKGVKLASNASSPSKAITAAKGIKKAANGAKAAATTPKG